MSDANAINYYRCPRCQYMWEDKGAAGAEDTCLECANKHVEPYYWEDDDTEEP